jgi:hypothetical protein
VLRARETQLLGFLGDRVEIAIALFQHLRAVPRQCLVSAAALDRADDPIATTARNHGDLLDIFAALEATKLLQQYSFELGRRHYVHRFPVNHVRRIA